MIKVMSASPEKIELPELNDRIYYKQEKVFSELDYKRSDALRRAIDMGNIIVLERSPDNKSFGAPPVADVHVPASSPPVLTECPPPAAGSQKELKPAPAPSDDKLDLVLKKIASLEDRIDYDAGKVVIDSGPLSIILERLKKLEESVSGAVPGSTDNSAIMQTLKALEEKINQGQSNSTEELIKRLEETVARAGSGSTQQRANTGPVLETYVPNVTVEDANSHINLKVRTVEKSDNVNSALDALKKLQGKSK